MEQLEAAASSIGPAGPLVELRDLLARIAGRVPAFLLPRIAKVGIDRSERGHHDPSRLKLLWDVETLVVAVWGLVEGAVYGLHRYEMGPASASRVPGLGASNPALRRLGEPGGWAGLLEHLKQTRQYRLALLLATRLSPPDPPYCPGLPSMQTSQLVLNLVTAVAGKSLSQLILRESAERRDFLMALPLLLLLPASKTLSTLGVHSGKPLV